jgi:hypothetical protein
MKVTNSSQSDGTQGVWDNTIDEPLIEDSPSSTNFQSDQPTENIKQNYQGSTQKTKRSEIDLSAQARATQLQQQLAQNVKSTAPQTTNQTTSSTNRIYKDGVTNLVAIASSTKYTAAEKEEYFRDYMSSSKENLRNLITGSELWPPEMREHVDSALISSEKLQERVAKELIPAQQTQVLDRLLASKIDPGAIYAIHRIIGKLDSASLDYVTSNLDKMNNFKNSTDAETANLSDILVFALAERAKDMSSQDSRLALTKKILESGVIDNPVTTQAIRYQTLQKLFGNLTADQKNTLFDQLQDHGELPKFAEAINSGGSLPVSILSGLTDKNVDFLRNVYLKLARDADQAGKIDLGNEYENNVLQLKGWLENHYPNYITK